MQELAGALEAVKRSDDLHAGVVVALEELEQLAGDAALEVPPDVAADRAAGGVRMGLRER